MKVMLKLAPLFQSLDMRSQEGEMDEETAIFHAEQQRLQQPTPTPGRSQRARLWLWSARVRAEAWADQPAAPAAAAAALLQASVLDLGGTAATPRVPTALRACRWPAFIQARMLRRTMYMSPYDPAWPRRHPSCAFEKTLSCRNSDERVIHKAD